MPSALDLSPYQKNIIVTHDDLLQKEAAQRRPTMQPYSSAKISPCQLK